MYDALGAQAAAVIEQLRSVPGVVDLNSTFKPGRPEIRFTVDRQKVAELGLSTAQIGSTIRTLVNGQTVTIFRGEGNEADITVQPNKDDATSVDNILDMSLLTPSGKLIPIRQVASPAPATGPNQISNVDRQPTIKITMNVDGQPIPVATAEVTKLVGGMQLPDGMIVQMAGVATQMTERFQSLGLAMLLSVVFIYMVLAIQFNSFIQPLLIMIALPLAIVGGLLFLLITGPALDMTAIIGFIMLMGLVTKNSILLVDFANRQRLKGANVYDAMLKAGPIRLRPIYHQSAGSSMASAPTNTSVPFSIRIRRPTVCSK